MTIPLRRITAILFVSALLAACLFVLVGRGQAMPANPPVWAPVAAPDAGAGVRATTLVTDEVCSGGSAAGYACSNVDLLAFMPFSDLNGGSNDANDIWGWTDPLNDREYAIMGRTNGTVFVDITDPVAPIYIGFLPTAAVNSAWRDIKVYQNHAFIVADYNPNHGMQVFDLTQLRTAIPGSTFSASAHYTGFSRAHNIAINEATGYAYVIGGETCSGGLHMIDIRQPLLPQFVGCYSGDGYTHDVQCVRYNGPDLTYIGREICFAANEDTVTIIDVTDKSAPALLGRTIGFSGCRAFQNCYVHQGWLSEDQSRFLVNDEYDELSGQVATTRTYVWNVSDLNNPTQTGTYDAAVTSIDHNLYTRGHSAYLANYSSGLRILDTRNIATPALSEIGFFDLYPANDNPTYVGAWSVYPYFASETLIVSSIKSGLFVLRANLPPDFAMTTDDIVLNACPNQPVDATFTFDALHGYSGEVAMLLGGKPNGVTANWSDPSPVVPNGTTLTLSHTGLPVGSHLLQVIATDGLLSQSEYLRLNVQAAAGAPFLLAPANQSPVPAEKVSFSWFGGPAADDYLFELATDPLFTPQSIVTSVITTALSVMTDVLDGDTQYFWRVTARSLCDNATSDVFLLGPTTPVAIGLGAQSAAGYPTSTLWTSGLALLLLTLAVGRARNQRQELLPRRCN